MTEHQAPAERLSEDIDDDKPLVRLRPDDGRPTWQQVNDLFKRFGMASPDWRMRDELVCFFLWARHGEKAEANAEALRSQLAEAREALKPFAALWDENLRDYPDADKSKGRPDDKIAWGFNNGDVTWGDFRRARTALSKFTPTPENK